MAVGQKIYFAKAVDKDTIENGAITYKLTRNPHNLFRIGAVDGAIYLEKPIRLDPGTEMTLDIEASDGKYSSAMSLTIAVKDVNDHTPIFDHTTYETSLIESTPINTRFFPLLASDADLGQNGRISFDITEGNADERFGLFPDGYLYLKQTLDREQRDYYSLSITCRDNGEPQRSSVVPIVIHIIDDNDNPPEFTNNTFYFKIAEGEPPNSFVGKLKATDSDIGRNAELIYVISTVQEDFIVDPRNGFIKTKRTFNREELIERTGSNRLQFDVVVTDNGEHRRLKDKAKVEVVVTDVNNNAPQFLRTPYKVQITEGAKIGTQFLRIHSLDADEGVNGQVFYSIIKGNEQGVFSIDETSGQMSLNKVLDRETTDSYTVEVKAENSGTKNKLFNTTKVLVEVTDENDNAPEFAQTNTFTSIEENRPVGTDIIKFKAYDSDLGVNAQLRFMISSGNKKEAFTIDSSTGTVYLNKPLDYEDTHLYQLNITCTDLGSPPLINTLLFKIYVVDVNDNPPNFPSTAIVRQIKEGIPVGTKIVTVLAEDPDSGANGKISYSISHQEPGNVDYFAINTTTGIIHTLRPIDREMIDTFRITVKAIDQAEPKENRLSAQKLVTVIVEDINDNAPQFISMNTAVRTLTQSSSNNQIVEQKVIKVAAKDLDSSTNGLVSYEIVKGDTNLFTIHRNTGMLTYKGPSNNSKKSLLVIRATDEAAQNERKSTDSYLTVFIISKEDVNDKDVPIFDTNELRKSVAENEPVGTSILKVTAKSQQRSIEYFVTNVTKDGHQVERLFDIDSKQGILTTADILDRESGQLYEVEVTAVTSNSGNNVRVSKTKVSKNHNWA